MEPDGVTQDGEQPVSHCGNQVAEQGEECDGTDLRGDTCAMRLPQGSGDLACTAGCSFDESGCAWCGDGLCAQEEDYEVCPEDCPHPCDQLGAFLEACPGPVCLDAGLCYQEFDYLIPWDAESFLACVECMSTRLEQESCAACHVVDHWGVDTDCREDVVTLGLVGTCQ